MRLRVLISGRGGLGVVELGNMLANYLMNRGFACTVVPTYGPQTRGGFVESTVVAESSEVINPIPTDFDVLIAMDTPAAQRFTSVVKGGYIVFNSTLFTRYAVDESIEVVKVPATEIAEKVAKLKLREPRVASNAAMLGAVVEMTGGKRSELSYPISQTLINKSKQAVDLNLEIAEKGFNYAEDSKLKLPYPALS